MSNIVGFQRVNGTNKQGQPYSGYRIFCTETRPNVSGLACDDVYVSDSYMPEENLSVGDQIDFVYNKFGRVTGINVIKKAGS